MELGKACPNPECQKGFRAIASGIRSRRSVNADMFDVWDTDLPYLGRYERVCRVCGKRLLKKNGDYSPQKRHCDIHSGQSPIPKMASWGVCVAEFIHFVAKKQMDLSARVKEVFQSIEVDEGAFLLCEKCNRLCKTQHNIPFYCFTEDKLPFKKAFFSLPLINIHHKKPVHTLSLTEMGLIWDFDNLIALCEPCHKDMHKRKQPSVPLHKWKTLPGFLSDKNPESMRKD